MPEADNHQTPLLEVIRAHLLGSDSDSSDNATSYFLDEAHRALNDLVDILEGEFAPDANEGMTDQAKAGRRCLARRLLIDLAGSFDIRVDNYLVPW